MAFCDLIVNFQSKSISLKLSEAYLTYPIIVVGELSTETGSIWNTNEINTWSFNT